MTDAQAKTTLLTGDELLKMPESATEGYELIEGELVPMAPTGEEHSGSKANVAYVLIGYNKRHKLGRVLTGEVGYYTRGDKMTVRAADVVFVSYARVPAGKLSKSFSSIPPDLIVEIVSPNDIAKEIEEKVREWLAFGVRMVWVVYPAAQRVHVYTSPDQARILDTDDTLDGGDVLPGFSVRVSEFFEE